MRVYLVRHAEAAPGEPDEARQLTPAGREQARELGMRLAAEAVRADIVLCSPLLRARETAELIARALGSPWEFDERLAPGATADGARAAAAGRGKVVVIVAHQPDCGQIAAALSGGPEPSFPPADAFAVDL